MSKSFGMVGGAPGGSGGGGITLASIAITTPPSKTTYKVGETFNATGMVVTAKYSNGATLVVGGYTVLPQVMALGTEYVTVTYTEGGVSATAQQAVTVIALSSIAITTPPSKTTYKPGETFSTAGMVVRATYTNGSTANVTGYTVSPTVMTLGTTYVTVTYAEGGISKSATQAVKVSVNEIIGVCWNYGNPSSELQRLTVANDPNKLVTMDITTEPQPAIGNGAGSSPMDDIYPWSKMREWNVVNGQITVTRGQSGFSLSNDTVVFIPGFYIYVTYDVGAKKAYYYVSQREASGFMKHPGSDRCIGKYFTGAGYVSKTGLAPLVNISIVNARAGYKSKGTRFYSYDFASWGAIQMLYLVEFANWNCQEKVGRGYVDGNSSMIASGGCDSMTYHTGRPAGIDGKTAVMYRWFENLWGDSNCIIDGINSNSGRTYVCTDPSKFQSDTANNYTDTGVTTSYPGGWISEFAFIPELPWAFLPRAWSGSSTAFVTDTTETSNGNYWLTPRTGGMYAYGNKAGLFLYEASVLSTSYQNTLSTRMLYFPDEAEIQKMAA